MCVTLIILIFYNIYYFSNNNIFQFETKQSSFISVLRYINFSTISLDDKLLKTFG